jgi:hypothetical protein
VVWCSTAAAARASTTSGYNCAATWWQPPLRSSEVSPTDLVALRACLAHSSSSAGASLGDDSPRAEAEARHGALVTSVSDGTAAVEKFLVCNRKLALSRLGVFTIGFGFRLVYFLQERTVLLSEIENRSGFRSAYFLLL